MNPGDFARDVETWQSAYVLIGGMAATLTGLLFVAVSINLGTVMSHGNPGLRHSAIRTFNQFVLIMELSIVFQIPQQSPITLGSAIVLLSAVAVAVTFFGTREAPAVSDTASAVSRATREAGRASVPSYALFAAFMVVGVLIMSGQFDLLYVMISLVLGTLISAVFSAWALLVEVGQDDDRPGADPAAEGRG